jgi:hypothetical protein
VNVDNRDAHAKLGHVTDSRGRQCPVFYDLGALDLSAVGALEPDGVRELEALLPDYWRRLAASRLRGLRIDDVHPDYTIIGDQLKWLLDERPADLAAVDWVEVGRRLAEPSGRDGLHELRRLHALLTGSPIAERCGP